MEKIKLPAFECLRCGHRWYPKREQKPRCCGYCKTPYWDSQTLDGSESVAKVRHTKDCLACKNALEVARYNEGG